MHDTGGHTSTSDTTSHSSDSHSHSSHTVHTSLPTWEQGPQHPTMNPGDPVSYYNGGSPYYNGGSPRQRGGGGLMVALILLAAVLPVVFTLLAFVH